MGVAVGDYDNDGYEDLYVVAYSANKQYQPWGWNVFRTRRPGAGAAGLRALSRPTSTAMASSAF